MGRGPTCHAGAPRAGTLLASSFAVEAFMQTLLPGHRRPAAALRAIVVTLATLAVATACSPDDPLPTGPRVTPPAAPRATVVGASVTVLEMTAYDINDAGQVVGVKGPSPGHAALWTS